MSHVSTFAAEKTVLRLPDGALTDQSLQSVRRCLQELDASIVHLDLGGIRLPTAEGLGALVVLNRELRACGGALVLFNLTAATYEVFTLTRLVEVLDVRWNDEPTACRSFVGRPSGKTLDAPAQLTPIYKRRTAG